MIIGDTKKRNKPHWSDFVLATAFEALEAEKCGKCGVPAWWAFSENNVIEFDMDEHECHACAHKDKIDKKVKEEKPGITRYVKAVPVEGMELPTRKDFQEEMLKKAAKAAEVVVE
jgi:hypothetical protein